MSRRNRANALLAWMATVLAAFGFWQTSSTNAESKFGTYSQLEEVLPLADGSTVAAGTTWGRYGAGDSPGPWRFLIKVTPGGSLDSSFGEGGVAEVPASAGSLLGLGSAPGGRLIVESEFELNGFRANGTADPGFAGNGRLVLGSFGDASGKAHAYELTDQFIYALQSAGSDSALVRFTLDGNRDAAFGNSGVHLAPSGQRWTDLEVDSAGRMVLSGSREISPGNRQTGVFRLLSDGSPDSEFGGPGGFVEADSSGRLRLLPDGRLYFLRKSEYPLVKDYCWNGMMASLGADGTASPFPSQMIGDCRIERLAEVLPNGDLVATHVSTFLLGYSESTEFSISRWEPRVDPDPDVWFGGAVPEFKRGIQVAPAGQSALAAAFDEQRGQIVAVGFAEAPICGETCDLERLMVLARFDSETGEPVTSFADEGAIVLPGNRCPSGIGPNSEWPRSSWNRCQVEAPRAQVAARISKPWSKRSKLEVTARPGSPPSYLWGTRQIFRLNIPKPFGSISRISKQLKIEVEGSDSIGTHEFRFEGRKLVLRYLAPQGGCGMYDCSDPDPTIEFRVRLGIQPGSKLRKALKRRSLRLAGSVAFQPDATRYEWGPQFSSWFAPGGKTFKKRIAVVIPKRNIR